MGGGLREDLLNEDPTGGPRGSSVLRVGFYFFGMGVEVWMGDDPGQRAKRRGNRKKIDTQKVSEGVVRDGLRVRAEVKSEGADKDGK